MEKKFTIPEAISVLFNKKIKDTYAFIEENASLLNFDGEDEKGVARKQKYQIAFFVNNIGLMNQCYDDKKISKKDVEKMLEKYYQKKIAPPKIEQDFEDYYDNFYDYKYTPSPEQIKAQEKNEKLIRELEKLRANAMGIGTNKLKRRLNKLAQTNVDAKICRLAFEIEDVSTQAKAARGEYKDKKYYKKTLLIDELVELYSQTDYHYGIEWKDGYETNCIIYFDLPNAVQISFHTLWDKETPIREYGKEWDGLVNSTFKKLIAFVEQNFKEQILKNGK